MKFSIYLDDTQQFRWRLRASNGRILADSGESYVRRADCEYAINLIKQSAESAPVEEAL